MDKFKLQNYINIAKKAGYVIIGSDKLSNYNKKLYLLIYDKSAQTNTLKVVNKLQIKGIPIINVDNLAELTSINNCKIIGIKNKSLSEIILKLFQE